MTRDPEPSLAVATPKDLRLAVPAVAAWLSAAVVLGGSPVIALAVAVTLGSAGLVALCSRRRLAWVFAAALLCAAAASAVSAVRLAALRRGPLPALAAAGRPVTAELTVTGDPQLYAGRVHGSALGRPLTVVPARMVLLQSRGARVPLRAPVTVLATGGGWSRLLPSQRVAATGRLAPPRRGDLVAAVLLARGPPRVLSGPSPVQSVAGGIRAGLRSASAGLPKDTAGLLPGLVVGDTSRLDPALRQDFRTTGMTHLVAVSGANVAIVLGAVLVLARWVRLGPRAGPAAAGLALAGFVVLARPSASVLRAAAMGLVVVLALATGRARAALPALSAAVLALVLIEPSLSRSIGFALSVTATAGLLVLAPVWRQWFARWLPGWLADAVAVPLAAQCACAPLIAAISAQVSLVAVPANLLAAPAVAPATLFGVLTALAAPWAPPVGRLLAEIAGVPAGCIVAVAHVGARLPAAAVAWPGGAAGAALLIGATAVAVVGASAAVGRRVLATTVVSVLLAVAVVRGLSPGWPPRGWQLAACDVGQGDALVLSAGGGSAVLVDAGPDPARVVGCLRALRVRTVPLVVLTHLHADHVEGLPAVLAGFRVREVEIGPLEEPREERDRVAGWVHRAGAHLTRVVHGEARTFGPLSWQVLAPARPFSGTSSDPNNSSIVLRVQLTGFTALLTGDVEPPAQRALLDSSADLRADVLKVPHHGSNHQDAEFLDAVAASLSLTSVGAGNTYGHPSVRTLDRLRADGARSYRTDRDGTVALATRGGAVVAVATRGGGTPAAATMSPAVLDRSGGMLAGVAPGWHRRGSGGPAARAPGSVAVGGIAILARRAALAPAARAPPPVRDWCPCRRRTPR